MQYIKNRQIVNYILYILLLIIFIVHDISTIVQKILNFKVNTFVLLFMHMRLLL